MRTIALSLAVTALPILVAPVVMADHHTPTLTPQDSGTLNRLQAVSAVNPRVVWVSGLGGTYAVTTDGGKTWRAGVVPGAETLQFRDVEGVNARVAYLMAAGSGTDSRIYKTEDGGKTWSPQFMNEEPDAFYDCFAFWNQKRGITFSDAVNGRFPVIRTTDGETWQDIGDSLPPAQVGEAGFAASGTCVAVQGGKRAWIGTGGAALARIFATLD
ncbi:MAG: glycosyl hydrolase, partial [Thermoanaerobaculia bacterium]